MLPNCEFGLKVNHLKFSGIKMICRSISICFYTQHYIDYFNLSPELTLPNVVFVILHLLSQSGTRFLGQYWKVLQ